MMPTFWKNIHSYEMALRVAAIMERLTGDPCIPITYGPRSYRILRRIELHPEERWIEA